MISKLSGKAASQVGFTLVEVAVAGILSAALGISMVSLTIMSQRVIKGTFTQQLAVKNAKSSIDGIFGINRQFSMAVSSGANAPQVFDSGGAVLTNAWGNRVDFSHPTDAAEKRRRFQLLPGDDGDMFTPWDNLLQFDPDTSAGGDEVTVATGLSPVNSQGAFRFTDATTPLTVQMRVGDPVLRPGDAMTITQEQIDASNTHTGQGLQGVEINITVAARN